MAQPVYPTLSELPDDDSFSRQYATDPTKRTRLEDGAYLVMATLTTVPLTWSFTYKELSATDRDSLLTFYSGSANYGAEVIKWTDPSNTTAYFVQFMGMPRCTLAKGGQNKWHVEVDFLQAIGTYT